MDGKPTGTLRSLVLLAALLLAAAAPAAAAQYDQSDPGAQGAEGAPNYAQAWKDVKAHLAAGNVTDARAVYDDTFAAGAAEAPAAKAAILAAFDDATNATGTDDLAYVAAGQAIDKSLYAVAYANVEAATDAGDVDAAKAWFGLLSAKFGSSLAGAQAAFANPAADDLPEAYETLSEELRTVLIGKVYKETFEVAPLLEAGDQKTAVKEAAEGRYYYLGIQGHVAETLGAEAEAKLVEELDELLEFAIANNAEAAEGEATEILALVAHYALASYDDEKGEAFTTYKGHIGDENLTAARAVYDDAFAEDAAEYAPAAHARVLGAFTNASAALDAGDADEYEIQSQILAKSVLDAAARIALHELEEGEVAEGAEWFRVLVTKFGWDADPSEAYIAVGHMVATGGFDEGYYDQALEGVYATFLDKVYEEITETLMDENWGTLTAREKAIEGVLYYQPLKPAIAATLNATVADYIEHELEELYDAATAVDREEAEHVAEEARTLLASYEAEKSGASGLDQDIAAMQRTLRLIKMEIGEYFHYMEQGDTATAQKEVAESKSFLARAESAFSDNEDALRAADADAAETIAANLADIGAKLQAEEGLDAIPGIVDDTNALLDSLKGAGVEPTVTIAFGAPTAGAEAGTIQVPVRLVGVPADGYAFQAEVYYPAEVLKATKVDVKAQVGAGTIEEAEGEVKFNAAATTAPGGEADVAVITFEVLDAAAAPTDLRVEVEDLTDAAGKHLGVKEVTGATVDVASANVEDGGNATPGASFAGLLLAVAVALVAGMGLMARNRGPRGGA